ncbi:Cse1 family protein [Nitzschia inconspicua]|uniref:Cse1 family protein n=1 Tax=Nitzschia inconspicua TaxID=303405 RepID=A0A9K3LGW3_9STRA|nr:Cse1 family protein [Nitzschia inconspicua]
MSDLVSLLADTLSYNDVNRQRAEGLLGEAAKQQGFLITLLQLIETPTVDDGIKQSAAVYFKNTVKAAWDTSKDEEDRKGIFISDGDRTDIKENLVELMCTAKPLIQSQISEAISIIAAVDYPAQWPTLLPKLVEKMGSPDVNVVNGVLMTADTIFKSFRDVMRSDALFKVIIQTLEIIQQPLLTLFEQVTQYVSAVANSDIDLSPQMDTLQLIVSIYHSLSYQDLPEHFEDNMEQWMKGFSMWLQYSNSRLESDDDIQPGPIDKLQICIIDVLKLFLERDEEEWVTKYVGDFTGLVWKRLMSTTSLPKHDQLVVTSMKYLSLLVSRPLYAHLFQADDALKQIVSSIIIPNMMARESDVEMFEDNPQDYIMIELEGSDSESRRRCSRDLLKAMCRQFEARTTAICSEHITRLIGDFRTNPEDNWASKDAAISLMVGITIRKESSFGVSEINGNVGLMDFFANHILPELQDASHDNRPMVKATSLNFVCTFRNQFSPEQLLQLLPFLIAKLGSDYVVVHSLAANAIEELLRCKQTGANGLLQYKLPRHDLEPLLQSLFTGLFHIIDNVALNENQYVMKCVMRTLDRAGDGVIGVMGIVFEKLAIAMDRVCKNPRDPSFNHNLFESIAILVKSVCSKDASRVGDMENLLFPPFETILHMDILEFTPYVFQILAQLLEYRQQDVGLGDLYENLFAPLLTAALWEKTGNVPGLTRLMQAYLKRAGPLLVTAGHLNPMLGIFQKLNSSKATESNAFELLSSLTEYVPQDSMKGALKTVFVLILTRLRSTKSNLYPIRSVQYFALFCGLYGGETFAALLNEIQPNLHFQIAEGVWVPKVSGASSSKILAKAQVIGLSRFAFDLPLLNDDQGQRVFAKCILAIASVLLSPTFTKEEKDLPDEAPMVYDATYSSLKYATRTPDDPFSSIIDPIDYFLTGIKTAADQFPGVVGLLMQQAFGADVKMASGFQSLLQSKGVNLA